MYFTNSLLTLYSALLRFIISLAESCPMPLQGRVGGCPVNQSDRQHCHTCGEAQDPDPDTPSLL